MTNYKMNVSLYQDVNFFDLFTYRYNRETDCYVSECDIAFEDLNQYDDDWYIDHVMEKEIINSVLKKANHYLVYADGITWDHAAGFKICDYPEECFRRNYDFNIYLKDVTPGGKVLRATETSHDCLGSPVYIIALTDREYTMIKNADRFETISNFVSKQVKKLEK